MRHELNNMGQPSGCPIMRVMNDKYFTEELIEKVNEMMEFHCELYTRIGSGERESPRWFSYSDVNDGKIEIESTQVDIWFKVEVTKEQEEDFMYGCHQDIRNEFKEIRTNFLKKHYPKIKHF